MADKRKPDFVLLLRKGSNRKTNKLELFSGLDFEDGPRPNSGSCWRLRLNGKWWPEGERKFFTKTEVKEIFFRSMK